MKNGLYALVAVLVGVMLVGLIPGQLSNLATPPIETTSLQGSKGVAGDNITISGGGYSISRANATISPSEDSEVTTIPSPTGATSEFEGKAFTLSGSPSNPYADLMYYSMMGIGLVLALGVYFLAKRILG